MVGRRYAIDGEGYSTVGRILGVAGETDTSLEDFLLPMALANDASVTDGEVVGDSTEAALVVLAAKGGLDVEGTRRAYTRLAEVPFDSDYKSMATFHERGRPRPRRRRQRPPGGGGAARSACHARVARSDQARDRHSGRLWFGTMASANPQPPGPSGYRRCPECQSYVDADAAYCPSCGADLRPRRGPSRGWIALAIIAALLLGGGIAYALTQGGSSSTTTSAEKTETRSTTIGISVTAPTRTVTSSTTTTTTTTTTRPSRTGSASSSSAGTSP